MNHPPSMDRLLQYMQNHPLLAGAAVVMAVAVIAYELRARAQASAAVAPSDAVRLMNQGAVLIDVRASDQFKAGHIGGSRNVPGNEITDGAKSLEKYREKTVITVCERGVTAGAAARQLARMGFKQVYNLRGGLDAWRQENLPLTRD